MAESVFQQIAAYLDPRFVRSVLAPVSAFWTGIIALAVTAAGWRATGEWFGALAGEAKVALVSGVVIWVVLTASFLDGQLSVLLRMYEGYLVPWPFSWIAERRRSHYRLVLARLHPRSSLRYFWYPATPRHVMPTRMGNLLRSSELYAYQRYMIDSVLVWPRLYTVLPDQFTRHLAAAKARVDRAVSVTTLAGAFALVGSLIAVATLPWFAAPACLWGGLIVAWLGYATMLRQARPYAELVKAAFDLYRGTLLATIGWTQPSSYGAERRQWAQICRLWYVGIPDGPVGAAALGYSGRLSEGLNNE